MDNIIGSIISKNSLNILLEKYFWKKNNAATGWAMASCRRRKEEREKGNCREGQSPLQTNNVLAAKLLSVDASLSSHYSYFRVHCGRTSLLAPFFILPDCLVQFLRN